MKKKRNCYIFSILFFIMALSTPLVSSIRIISPTPDYKPLPLEKINIEWEGAIGVCDLYYKTNIDLEWQLVAESIVGNSYYFICPDYFFDTIDFKSIETVSQRPILIREDILDDNSYKNSVEFSRDGKKWIIGTFDGNIIYFENDEYSTLLTTHNSQYSVKLKYDIENSECYVYYYDSPAVKSTNIKNINPQTHFKITEDPSYPNKAVEGILALNDISDTIVCAIHKGSKLLISTIDEYINFNTDGDNIYSLCISPNSRYIAYALYSGKIYVYSILSKNVIKIIPAHIEDKIPTPIYAIDWSQDGKFLVSGGLDSKVKIWDIENNFNLISEYKHNGGLRTVKFHPTLPYVMSSGYDAHLIEWNYSANKINFDFDIGYQGLSIDYSPAGDSMIAVGRSRMLKMWKRQEANIFYDSVSYESDYSVKIFYNDTTLVAGKVALIPCYLSTNPRLDKSLLSEGLALNFYSLFPKKRVKVLGVGIDEYPNIDYEAKYNDLNILLGDFEIEDIVNYRILPLYYDSFEDSILIKEGQIVNPVGAKIITNNAKIKVLNECFSNNEIGIGFEQNIDLWTKTNNNNLNINFELEYKGNYTVYMVDMNGKKVLIKEGFSERGKKSLNYSLNNISKGIYFVFLKYSDMFFSVKVII